MAISESIKSASQDLETALAEADTGVRALLAATGEHSQGNGLVDFHMVEITRLSNVALELVTLINRESRK